LQLPASDSEVQSAVALLPLDQRIPISDVLYVVNLHIGIRIGTSGGKKDDQERVFPFGIVVRSVVKAYQAAATALAHAQAGATPVASGLTAESPAHQALVKSLQTMVQYAPKKSMWDLLGANDIVSHLKDRIADVSSSILGRSMEFDYAGTCCCPRYNLFCSNDQSRKEWTNEGIQNLFAEIGDRVVQPLVDTYSGSNLRGGQDADALISGQPRIDVLNAEKPKLIMIFPGKAVAARKGIASP
jgi:hypothetical protein